MRSALRGYLLVQSGLDWECAISIGAFRTDVRAERCSPFWQIYRGCKRWFGCVSDGDVVREMGVASNHDVFRCTGQNRPSET